MSRGNTFCSTNPTMPLITTSPKTTQSIFSRVPPQRKPLWHKMSQKLNSPSQMCPLSIHDRRGNSGHRASRRCADSRPA